MDVSQYLGIFLDETNEHLQTLSDQLLILENEPENEDTINQIFRAAHSLKGMAGTMGYKRMQNLTHDMENVFSEVRNGKIKVDGHMVDILFQALDALEEYRENISESQDEGTNDNEHIIKELQAILNGEADSASGDSKEEAKSASAEEASESSASSGSEEGKWNDIVLHEPEQHVISEAIKNSQKVYGFTVYIQESCILKAARAFLVFKALEELGEVIISEPSVQDIEDEKFDFDFSLYFVTDSSIDKVKEAIMSVSEIDHVIGDAIDMDKAKIADEDDEEAAAHAGEAKESSATTAPTAGSAYMDCSYRLAFERYAAGSQKQFLSRGETVHRRYVQPEFCFVNLYAADAYNGPFSRRSKLSVLLPEFFPIRNAVVFLYGMERKKV